MFLTIGSEVYMKPESKWQKLEFPLKMNEESQGSSDVIDWTE